MKITPKRIAHWESLKKPLAYVRVIDKVNIPEEFDRRRKLTKAQHATIKKMYKTGNYSRYYLADMFGVAYGTIQRLTSESARRQLLEAGKRWRAKNPNRKRENCMLLRRRKKELAEKGLIKIK